VIPYANFAGLRLDSGLCSFEAPKYGRHCGFIEQLDDAGLADRCVLHMIETLPVMATAQAVVSAARPERAAERCFGNDHTAAGAESSPDPARP